MDSLLSPVADYKRLFCDAFFYCRCGRIIADMGVSREFEKQLMYYRYVHSLKQTTLDGKKKKLENSGLMIDE
jgi:hypothetical protein